MASEAASASRVVKSQADRLAALEPLLDRFRERRRKYDEAGEFPSTNFEELRAAGLLALSIPSEYGGADFWWRNFTDYYDIYERIAAVDSSTAQLYQIQTHGAGLVAWHGSPGQRERYCSQIAEEGLLVASVGSEAAPQGKSSESYVAELQPSPDGWLLNCHKHFASMAPGADYLLIWVALPGAAPYMERQVFVLVPREAPGVELINEWDTMGMRATVSWAVKIENYEVPADAVFGKPGAWAADPRTFTLGYVANHLGTAKGALSEAIAFVSERPYLAENPVIQVAVGDLASRLEVSRSAMYDAARRWEVAAESDWDALLVDKAEMLSLESLHVSKEVAHEVTRRAFDLCGARAAFRHMPFDMMFRDVRTFTLHHREFDYMGRVGKALLEAQTAQNGR